MTKSSVRPTDANVEDAVKNYSNMLFKLCFAMLCNNSDAEDAVSDTFLKYITKSPAFCDEEHKKAWLIRVATNVCRDMYRFKKRNNYINIDEICNYPYSQEDKAILEEIVKLKDKYKIVLHLFYIEGYKTEEIANILSISASTVRKRLQYGRQILKFEYEREY